MEKIQLMHSGRFTLRSRGQAMPGNKFQATFVVTEHKLHADEEIKRYTGALFDTEIEAAEAGLEAAKIWLDEHRPIG